MGKLDSLKIDDCPYAFASFAAKHNALVDMLAGMVGQNGISVVLAEKNAIIRGAGGAGGNVTIDNVATANVVGAGGYLANAYVANANIGTFPTLLRTGAPGGAHARMEPTGIVVQGDAFVNISNNQIWLQGAHEFVVYEPLLTHDMGIKEIDVCSGNVAMKMLVIASEPYAP